MFQRIFLCLALSFAINGYSLYYGSPALPEVTTEGLFIPRDFFLGVKVGYEGDFLFDRSLKPTNHHIQKMDVFEYHMQQGVITANFVDRFEVYSSLGAMKFHIEPRVTNVSQLTMETGNHFTWGVGARAIIFGFSTAAVGLDVKYQKATPHFDWILQNGAPIASTDGAKLNYQEWQIGLGISYQTGIFTPYIGAIFCQTLSKYRNFPVGLLAENATSFKVKSRSKFGMAVGTSLSDSKIFDLEIEGRLIDETAVTITGSVRF